MLQVCRLDDLASPRAEQKISAPQYKKTLGVVPTTLKRSASLSGASHVQSFDLGAFVLTQRTSFEWASREGYKYAI